MNVRLLTFLCLVTAFLVCAQDISPTFSQAAITIDGKLEENAWKTAPKHTDFKYLKANITKGVPPIPTSFQILVGQDSVILGMWCQEPLMDKLVCKADHESTDLWGDDRVEVFISPGGLKETYYQFAVTARNTQWMQYFEGAGITTPDLYHCPIESAVFRGKDFWSVEIRLPLRAFYLTPCAAWRSRWLLNVVRERKAGKNFQSLTWSPLAVRFHEPEAFRAITHMPPKPPAYDLMIASVQSHLKTKRPDGKFDGHMTVNIQAQNAFQNLKLTLRGKLVTIEANLNLKAGPNTFDLPATFLAEGHDKAFLQLKNAQKTIVTQRFYPFNAAFTPLKFHFDKPFYSQCFFPGQDASHIRGHLDVTDQCKELILTVGTQKHRLHVKDGKAIFNVPNPQKEGRIVLKAAKIHNGTAEDEVTTSIRILKPIPHKMVWIEEPNRLVVNGKPTFGLGWYCGGGKDAFLVSHAFGKKYPRTEDKHPFNFKLMPSLEPIRLIPGSVECTKDQKPTPQMLQKVDQAIQRLRTKDFDCYYLVDEPEFHGGSAIYFNHLYRYIKEQDPYHPVMIITTEPIRFINCADILNPHFYICPRIDDHGKRSLKRPVRNIAVKAREFASLKRKGKLFFGTPQTFNYRFVNQQADFPTFDETNAWIWAMICNGGQGLTPFLYYDHASRPALDLGIDFIYNSIHRLSDCIAAPIPPTKLQADNPQVEHRLMITPHGLLLMVANATTQPQAITLHADELKPWKKLHLFREDGMMPVNQGTLKLTLNPYQVHVLTSVKMDQGLFSLETLRQRIDKAEKERCSSPSILFEQGHVIDIDTSPCVTTDTMVREDKFFDGVRDVLGWRPTRFPANIDLGFTKGLQTFSKVRVYGWNLQNMQFSIRKAGKWKPMPQKPVRKGDYEWEWDFGQNLSTIKCRFFWKTYRPRLEIYEIELIK